MKPFRSTKLPPVMQSPADAARALGAQPAPVIEIVTFRLIDGADDVAFIEAARGTETLLRARGALVRRYLVRDADGLWTDIVEWTSMQDALSAAEAVMKEPDFAAFGAMIDPQTVVMRHAPVLWRMD